MSLKFKLTMTQLAEQTDGHICPVTVICTMALSLINGLTFTKHRFIKLKALSGALMACLLVSIFLMLHSAKAAEINPPDLLEKIAKIQRETESEFHNIQTDIPEQHEQRYKPLSIGTDFVDYEKSLDFYKSKFDVFILGIATPDCNECDEMETLLDQFTRLCAMKEIEYKGKNVPVVRIDGRKYINMINHEQIFFKDRPLIGLFSKGVYYNYEKGPHLNLFLHFINRHLYPIVILSSKEAIENFRNTTKEWVENTPFYRGKYRNIEDLFPEFTKVTRVIAFVAQKGEYKYELSQLSNSAKKLGYRDDLRIAKVVDPALVKEYKESMKKKWFEPKSINSIVVFSKDKSPEDNLNSLDLSIDGGVNFEHWINSASIEPFEELTVQSLQIMLPMYMPIFAVFIDKNYAIYGSKSFNILNILNELCLKYPQYLFGYVKNNQFDQKKEQIGIYWNDLPSLALLNPPENIKIVFPKDIKTTKENVDLFLDKAIESAMKNETLIYKDSNNSEQNNLSKNKESTSNSKTSENTGAKEDL